MLLKYDLHNLKSLKNSPVCSGMAEFFVAFSSLDKNNHVCEQYTGTRHTITLSPTHYLALKKKKHLSSLPHMILITFSYEEMST